MGDPKVSISYKKLAASISVGCLSFAMLAGAHARGQTAEQKSNSFPLWNFDEANHTCRAKGRLQDKEYCKSKLMDQIVAQGKGAIPILISQLADSRKLKNPIYDYWNQMTVGDVAYFILNDLFTEPDWTTFNMPGLEAVSDNCRQTSESCWRDILKKHGRTFVQNQWLAAWNANKDRIYWDAQARCFRLSRNTKGQ
jgi:hypothetical protein